MEVKVEIIKDLPVKEINKFEDRTIYNCAVFTREFTKSKSAFPYRTGNLMRSEIASPIVGSNKEYGLTAGVDYAIDVWYMKNVYWTNPSTQPQWYYSVFNKNNGIIIQQAVNSALKEV